MASPNKGGTVPREVLQEVQDSLATALARLQSTLSREAHYKRENIRLRALLREAGVNNIQERLLTDAASPATEGMPGPSGANEPASSRESGGGSSGPEVEPPPHIIDIHTDTGKITAQVLANSSSMEFVEVKARVTPSEFVGVCTLTHPDNASKGPNKLAPTAATQSPNFFNQLFRRRSDRDLMSHDAHAGTGETATASSSKAAGDPHVRKLMEDRLSHYLSRHSWNGVVTAPGGSVPDLPGYRAEADASSGGASGAAPGGREELGTWQIIWKDGGGQGQLRTLTFDTTMRTRAFMHRQVEDWCNRAAKDADGESDGSRDIDAGGASAGQEDSDNNDGVVVQAPVLLTPGSGRTVSKLLAESEILTPSSAGAVAAHLPTRYKQAAWKLIYSTEKHGFSLQQMYRKAANLSPVVLVVRDTGGYKFGMYTSDALKVAPRYYGTGETFVFQLQPHLVAYNWKADSADRNDFFVLGSQDSLGIGGGPHFALWVDSDLLYGTSGTSGTFASPCLASCEEFKILALELWHLT